MTQQQIGHLVDQMQTTLDGIVRFDIFLATNLFYLKNEDYHQEYFRLCKFLLYYQDVF